MRYPSSPCLYKIAPGMETGATIQINNASEAC